MTLLCAGLFALKADAQIVQSGRVSDALHAGVLPGATIRIDDERQTVAGDDGRFRLKWLTAGSYKVSISVVGYRSKDTILKSFIFLGAPHTSNYDFIPAMAVAHLLHRNSKFVIKDDWLKFPMNLVS